MKKRHSYSLALMIILFSACKNVCKYPIDEPHIKIDKQLLGIWKAVEDTDKYDYILVQDLESSLSRVKRADRLYLKYEYGDYMYFITRMDAHGQNPHYQQWHSYISNVNNSVFLNIAYTDARYRKSNYPGALPKGYFFVKLAINNTADTITAFAVSDTTLYHIRSSQDLQAHIKSNLRNPSFYRDTIHFYKVNGYYAHLTESIQKANPKK